MKRLDLIGQRFGKLVVVSKTTSDKFRAVRWVCKCDCGKEHIATTTLLRAGSVSSCGCYRDTFKLLPGDEGSFNSWLHAYVYNSRKKEFLLTKEEFRLITSKSCFYCGAEPIPHYARNRKVISPIPYLCNGIDRMDNEVGYVFSNCVPCCGLCNYMKRGLSHFEFMDHVRKIFSHSEVK